MWLSELFIITRVFWEVVSCWFVFLKIMMQLEYFSIPFSTSLSSNILLLFSFKFMASFLTDCCCLYVLKCTYACLNITRSVHIIHTVLLVCMFFSWVLGTGQPFSVFFPSKTPPFLLPVCLSWLKFFLWDWVHMWFSLCTLECPLVLVYPAYICTVMWVRATHVCIFWHY